MKLIFELLLIVEMFKIFLVVEYVTYKECIKK